MRREVLACFTVAMLLPALAFAGFTAPSQPAPALGDAGLAALGMALVGGGIAALRRRSR